MRIMFADYSKSCCKCCWNRDNFENFYFHGCPLASVLYGVYTLFSTFWPTVNSPLIRASILALLSIIICDPSASVM